MARTSVWIDAAVSFVMKVFSSFLDFKEEDGLKEKGIKTADLIARRIAYFVTDSYIFAASVSMGGAMKALDFSFSVMFGVIWIFDFVVASTFVVIYEVTGKDPSLGMDFRRAADTANKKSKIAGFLIMAWNVVMAIAWNGPEKAVTFFRNEIGTAKRVIVALIVLTAIQAFIWAALYYFAFGWVMENLVKTHS